MTQGVHGAQHLRKPSPLAHLGLGFGQLRLQGSGFRGAAYLSSLVWGLVLLCAFAFASGSRALGKSSQKGLGSWGCSTSPVLGGPVDKLKRGGADKLHPGIQALLCHAWPAA